MGHYIRKFRDSFRKGDSVLLFLCVLTTAFGILIISSATNASGNSRYVIVQAAAALLGIFAYSLVSTIDAEFFSEHRNKLVIFNVLLLLMLIPFGVDYNSGNKSWVSLPGMPVDIQPAEICKITFILIMASVMASNKNRCSSVRSILQMGFHIGLLAGLNMVLSGDLGVTLIFVFIFIAMTFTGGVSYLWFIAAGGTIAVAAPVIWNYLLDSYQKIRIQILFDPSMDALGTGARYHIVRSLKSLTGGGFTGQGLFQGNRTQTYGALPAQHTDFIFSAIGEELGYLGCAIVILLLIAIIARCIWVGTRSQDYMRRLICFGAAAALIFQVSINIGMCIGIAPVIGLTLPFVSYGGSSIVTLYAMLGLVSGVYARPAPTSQERYVRPPYLQRVRR